MSMREILKGKKYQTDNNNNNNYPDATLYMTPLSLDVLAWFFLGEFKKKKQIFLAKIIQQRDYTIY